MKRTLLLLPLLALAVGGAGCRDVKRALTISQEDSARILALRDRIAAGDVSAVGELDRSVNYVFDDGSTPLFVAIAACDSNVVAALVERGADVNKAFQFPRYSEFDRADVHNVDLSPMAAALANLEPRPRFGLVRFLPAPDVPEERYAKSKAIARFLLDHGADPTEALTAVAVVPEKDFDEMLALVARAGADPDKTYREPGSYSVAYAIEARFAIEKDRLRRQGASEESRKWMDELDDRLRRIRAIATNAPAASETHAESAESAEPVPHADPR